MTETKRFLLVLDVDGTLTTVRSIWEYLLKCMKKWDIQGSRNLQAYLSGEIDYPEFARLDALEFKGSSAESMGQYMDKIPWRVGVETLLRRASRRGGHVVLLSSGLDLFLERFPHVDEYVANRLCFENGVCTGEVDVRVPMDEKHLILKDIIAKSRLPQERIIVVGDSEGDLQMMQLAGFSIAVNPSSDKVGACATATVDGSNMITVMGLIEDYLTGEELKRPRRSH